MTTSKLEGFRLSGQQSRLWLLQEEGGRAYVSRCAVSVEGRADAAALRGALNRLASKYEILRTTFRRRPGLRIPFQVIDDDGRPSWRDVDLRGLDAREQEAEVEKLFEREGLREFDLEHGPALHASLVSLSDERAVLLLTLPSLCADSRSLELLTAELAALYEAPGAVADEETLQYADYAAWQQEMLEGEESREGRAYWQAQLAGASGELTLPGERRRAGDEDFEPARMMAVIEGELLEAIRAGALSLGTTTAVVLHACWQALLWRLTNQSEVVVGQLFAGGEELPPSVGPFERRLPVRAHFDAGSRLGDIVGQLEAGARAAAEWQESYEGPKGKKSAGPDRAEPFLHAGFEHESEPSERDAAGLKFYLLRKDARTDRFKLKLRCVEGEGSLLADFHFDAASLDAPTAELFAARFERLLGAYAKSPDAALSELELLGEGERRRLLYRANDTRRRYEDADACVHQLFERQAAHTPDAVALVFEDERLTYAELNARANRLARRLRSLGVGPETVVGLCVERSIEMIVGMFAIMKAGGAYVPVEPSQPRERLSFILEDVRAPVVLTQRKLAARLSNQPARVICLDADSESFASESAENLEGVGVSGGNLVYVLFTSGSTGVPKGVAVEHRQLVNYINGVAERLSLPADASYAYVSTFAADLGNTMLFPALCGGGRLHVLSHDRASDPAAFADYFERHEIDCLKIVPSHLQSLLTWPEPQKVLPRRRLVLGGEASRRETVQRVRELAPECEVYNHYGPTETTVGVVTYHATSGGGDLAPTVPLGRPLPNTEIYLLDGKLRPVALGALGELYVGGAQLARNYLNRPDLTAERFIPDPFGPRPGERLYRTGDLARYLPDGNLEFLGRADNQVKFHGFRVELDEIRAALNKHPKIRESVVVTRVEGGGRASLVAYYASRHEVDRTELRQFLAESIIEETIPNVFVHLKRFPLTLNGKIDYGALPEPQEAQGAASARACAEPRTPAERALADIWKQVLRVERVGINDNFFELGGDSILSIQIIGRANQAGLRLTPTQIFQHQTVAELAAVAGQTAQANAEQGSVTGGVPLTPIQRWFFEMELPEPHHWNQSMTLELSRAVEFDTMCAALMALVAHHDALRLRFAREAGGWRQWNAGAEEAELLSRVDLSAFEGAEQETAFEEKAAALQASLNLSEGPLVRACLFVLGAGRAPRMEIVAHHLAVDGVSWRVLLGDLETAYAQLSVGRPVALPPKTTSFKHWAEKLEEYARSGGLKGELDYWLRETPEAAPLPTDFEGGANTEGAAGRLRLVFDDEETRALLQDVPAVHHTQINEALLAALVEGFAAWTGERSLLVNMEGHGREDVVEGSDLSRTVGWFTTHFPLRVDLGPAGNVGASLRLVKERLRGVPQRGIGYGLLRYLCGDDESMRLLSSAPAPAPEVSFNYLGQFDQLFDGSLLFAAAREFGGATRSPRAPRARLIEVNAVVLVGRLHVEWVYAAELHARATVERLSENFAEAVRAVVSSCRRPEAASYSASDFPLAEMDEQEMGKLSLLLDALDGVGEAAN
ncbi:MAG: amino acid adenylation domain-containing protein [Acidobacteria bacterium]|nr:amino acid adenylation domain-containing protein [Acidobacteriota bacterium]